MTWSFDEGYVIDIIIMEINWLSIDTGVVMDTIVLTAIFISDSHVKWQQPFNF